MPRPRKKQNKKPEKTLRIFCEGSKTEPYYIKGYIQSLSNQGRKSVFSVEKTDKNTPVQLVEAAKSLRLSRESLPEDEIWVVYDRESTAKYPDEKHETAMTLADTHGIKVALNNVCFESWILLHLVDSNAPYSSYDDLRKNSGLKSEFKKKYGVEYDKSSQALFELIKAEIPNARTRGKRQNKAGIEAAGNGNDQSFQINPYVGMVSLLDAIDAFE